MKIALILAASILAATTSMACAQDISPNVLLEANQSSVPGRAIDIRGLVTGMSTEEALAAMVDLGGVIDEGKERTALSSNGVTVTGTPFTKWLSVNVDGDRTVGWFSGVSSGNQLTLLQREADYRQDRDNAPLFDPFIASLLEKYGEPSFRKDGREVSYFMWTYKDGRPAACDPNGTPPCVEPETAKHYLHELAALYDVIVFAKVGRKSGEDRLLIFELSATDLSIMDAAAKADEAGLRPALEAAISAATTSAPKPSL